MDTQQLIVYGLSALFAATGSFLLWKYYALPKISLWFVEYGSNKLRSWLKSVVDEPDGESAVEIGKLTSVAFAYLMQGIIEDLGDKERRQRWTPIFDFVQEHIMQSVFASWGHILNKLKTEGAPLGGALPEIPPALAGLAGRFLPKGVGMSDVIPILNFLSRFQSQPSGTGGSSFLPSGPSYGAGNGSQLQAPK